MLTSDRVRWTNNPNKSRKLGIISITPEVVVELLSNGTHIYEVIKGIPKDAKVVGVDYEYVSNVIRIMLEHDSYYAIGEGHVVPEVETPEIQTGDHYIIEQFLKNNLFKTVMQKVIAENEQNNIS